MTTHENVPQKTVSGGVASKLKSKGKLVIFDDSAKLLMRFTETFTQLGYEVIPVYVSDRNYDRLIADGKFKRGIPQDNPSMTYREEKAAASDVPENTLDTEMAELQRQIKTPSDRHQSAFDQLEMMSHFTYAVKSKTDVANILREVQPDFVLSDMEMRRPEDPDMSKEDQAQDDNTVLGNHVMAIAAHELPEVPRAIHSGLYTIDDDLRARINAMDEVKGQEEEAFWRKRYDSYLEHDNASPEALKYNYRHFPKDETGQTVRAEKIDVHFEEQRGRGLG